MSQEDAQQRAQRLGSKVYSQRPAKVAHAFNSNGRQIPTRQLEASLVCIVLG